MSSASAFDMSALDSRIRELVAYARERDGEDRSILFRNLIDLFLTGKAPQINPTRTQLLDVIEALIPHVDSDNRRTAADLIASMANPPIDLAIRLCRDRASLVNNLLQSLPMEEEEIIELIERTGREHHQIIAKRNDLSANVWISLARAAPAAPPFDNQSTLALWSDDLGITRTTKHTSATVTPFPEHKTKQASIRILKTDEDLIAERAKDGVSETEFPDVNAKAEIETASTSDIDTPPTAPNTSDLQFLEPTVNDDIAKDPSPGGWSWISDRDGFVSSISPFAVTIYGEGYANGDTSILDLLGLNEKLGHPVARAFQRRSAIHDAPVSISFLDPKHQHWTMDASPIFSQGGGIFEGYNGNLAPVVPAKGDDTVFPSETEANALFLDEVVNNSDLFPSDHISVAPQRPSKRTPASFIEKQTVLEDSYDNDIPTGLAHLERPSAETLAKATVDTSAPMGDQPAISPAPQEAPNSQESSPIASAADAIASVLAEQKVDKTKEEVALPASVEWQTNATNEKIQDNEAIASTIEMLEESISRLNEITAKSNNPQANLQCEIAHACIRTLKDQLKNS